MYILKISAVFENFRDSFGVITRIEPDKPGITRDTTLPTRIIAVIVDDNGVENVNNWSIIIASLIATGIGLLAVVLVSRKMVHARTELRSHHRAIEASVNAIVIMIVKKPEHPIEYP